MSIAQQEQIKSLLYRVAELTRRIDSIDERIIVLEKQYTEQKQTLTLANKKSSNG